MTAGASSTQGWRRLVLGDPMLVDAQVDALAREAIIRLGSDAMLALRHESTGDLHCQVIAYFSPGADDWARSLGGRLCAAPMRSGLSVLAGDHRLLDTLE
ncbi:hypothetical protein KEM63_05455 [Halopseudomonas nanhaiensis]|uniref:hypothetical protein n=1 Tax=Halopseudomonas nanhaiensis TaxID=2830842 RepID=UPI001CBB0630|nr:hypothetical protein [Halopseudomonas nanhaiensis]UAW99413.1 hypothetical protein KEM63_05455 [Halopseudomonas nanhaiensis]